MLVVCDTVSATCDRLAEKPHTNLNSYSYKKSLGKTEEACHTRPMPSESFGGDLQHPHTRDSRREKKEIYGS